MTIVSHKHTRVRDETISHGNVSFTIPSKLLEHTQGIKASAPCEFLRAHCSCYSDCCYSVCLLHSIVWISSIVWIILSVMSLVQDCYSTTMMQYPVNPFKAGVHSAVTSINVFDCDGKEITDIRTDDPEAHVGFAVPSLHNEV